MITGFLLSLVLTLSAYFIVVEHLLSGFSLFFSITGLGVMQAAVQLIFFLHLGKESKPRHKLLIFTFMLVIGAIIVGGSLWIMHNLNYHMG